MNAITKVEEDKIKQICSMVQSKTSLKVFEPRNVMIVVFGKNKSGSVTQDGLRNRKP